MNDIKEKRLVLAALVVLILFQAVSNYFWLKADHYIPLHDENEYLVKSVNTLRLLTDPGSITLKDFLEVEPKLRTHFFALCAWPFFLLGGISYGSACLTSSFFLVVLIIATFGIGNLLGGRWRGLLAALIVSCYPFILRFSRFFWSEIALAASFALFLYLLLRTRSFKSRGYSFALALVIAAGLLLQQRFAFFVVTPLAWALLSIFFPAARTEAGERGDRRPRLINFLIALLIPALLTVPYYLYYGQAFSTKFTYGIIGEAWQPVEGFFNPATLFWYLGHLQKSSSLFFFILWTIGLVVMLVKYRQRYLPLLLAFIGGYLLITIYPGKDARYVSSLLPLAAVITAEGISRLKSKMLKKVLIPLMVLMAIFNYLRVSWDVDPFKVSYQQTLLEIPFLTEPLEILPHTKSPRTLVDWQWERIVDRVKEELNGRKAKLLVAPYLPGFNYLTFSYFCLLSGERIESVGVGTRNLYHYNFNNLLGADYIVTKTGASVPESHIRYEFAEKTAALIADSPAAFRRNHREIARYPLPDGSEAILIARTAPVDTAEEMAVLEEVVRIEPEHPWALRELGEIYLKEGRPEDALKTFERIIPLQPEWVGGYLSVGRAYVDLGRTEEAIAMIERVLKMAPKFDFAHYSLGTAYEQAGRIEEARREYIEATRGSEERAREARKRLEQLPD